jgi:endogenous inhibitor of DNA gyrase (YacG/DUF329 family)
MALRSQMTGHDSKNSSGKAAAVTRPCPTCGKPATHAYRPFCSRRCADVDLHRWLAGAYAIPAKEDEDEDGAAALNGSDHGEKQD